MKKRIVLAVTGASGIPYAVKLAQALSLDPEIELHLILSEAAKKVLAIEAHLDECELSSFAHTAYTEKDIAAGPASGSWIHHGMIVCPCSMASLAAIAQGLGHNLIHRAADVTLKEGRKLILVPRETPFNKIHLKNMLAAADAGATILPACPGFYHQPESLDDIVAHMAGKVLDQLGIPHSLYKRWE